MRIKSHIKERMLQHIGIQGISKYEFYKKTGITRGILDKEYGISEENILKYITYYSEVSFEWLLTGRGPMFRPDKEGNIEIAPNKVQALEEPQTVYQQIPHISQRVGDLMRKKRFNYRTLGNFLGYADVSIAQIVKGKCKPNVAFLEILLEKIPDLNPEWLLTGNGKMFRTANTKREDHSSVSQGDQQTGMSIYNQEIISYSSDSKEKDLIIEKLKNDLTEQKQSHERIMEEKDGVIHSLRSRLADKDEMIRMKDKQLEDLKSNFEQIVAGRDKQIEDLKSNLERLISEKSEVVKMKDEMLAMKEEAIKGKEATLAAKDETISIQSKRISELESHELC